MSTTIPASPTSLTIDDAVDTTRFPLSDVGSTGWVAAVDRARAELAHSGCTVLRDFIALDRRAELRAQCAGVAGRAYTETQTVNVYNTAPDRALPLGHPGRVVMERGNSFVASDHIPADLLIHRLYLDEAFQRFLAACLGVPRVHPLADPYAGLCLNVVEPGRQHPWHFDTNEYAVSLLTQAPDAGGGFEYCPGIRSPGEEHFDDVAAVLDGDRRLVRTLTLRPGDLQLFRGRFSLHRVSPVEGTTARHTAIFSYSEQAGVVGSPERTRQLFGRVDAVHTDRGAHTDGLLD